MQVIFAPRQMQFEYIISLPNEKKTRIILDDRLQYNYISRSIVDDLLKTGEIVVEGDQAFVEIHRRSIFKVSRKVVRYFDGAWCTITSLCPHIKLGRDWMMKRHVTIEPDQSACIIQPPHLPGRYHFSKYIPASVKPIIQDVIYEADRTLADLYEEQTRAFDLLQDTWDQSLLVESELDLIDDSILTADSTFVSTLPAVRDDTLLEVDSVDALSDAMLFQDSPFVDPLWLDFCEHIGQQIEVPGVIIYVPLHTRSLSIVFVILRHFKIRGRIFSNRGRMMGIEMHGTHGATLGTPDAGQRTRLAEDEQRRCRHVFVLLSLCCNKAQMRTT